MLKTYWWKVLPIKWSKDYANYIGFERDSFFRAYINALSYAVRQRVFIHRLKGKELEEFKKGKQ